MRSLSFNKLFSVRSMLILLILCISVSFFGILKWLDGRITEQPIDAAVATSIYAVGGLALLFSLLAFYLGTRYLVSPLEKLLNATQYFSSGDLQARPEIDCCLKETAMLVKCFDQMADALKNKELLQKAAEAELRLYASRLMESEKHAQLIMDSTPIVLTIIEDSTILAINQKGTQLLGIRPGDPTLPLYVDPEQRTDILRSIERGENVENMSVKMKNITDGRVYDTLMSLRPSIYEGKNVLLTWIFDVTELVVSRMASEKAARAKSEFLAGMSHEIRTPMNAILGLSHLCLQTEMSEKQRNYLSKIHGAATSLLSIINDILDFSKIEAGKLTLESTTFHLSENLRDLWDRVAPNAEEKGLHFSLNVEKEIPDCLVGDVLRLNQVLLNLCNNAIKFTDGGEIVVHVSADEPVEVWGGAKTVRLYFAVSDTGIGMTAEQVQSLFTPFSQADTSSTRKYGGSGLGLSISKQLVEAMDGTISVQSVFGEGSTFRFSVRFAIGIPPSSMSPVTDIRGLRALVVDDNPMDREILQEALLSLGLRADTAVSGIDALEKVRAAYKERNLYDFLILDWRMPWLDGEATAHQIREEFGAGERPRILMVSAYSDEDCRAMCKRLEIAAFCSKPITRSDLYDALTNMLTREERKDTFEVTLSSPVEQETPEMLNGEVLLVEDNLINQEVAGELLRQCGVNLEVAANGAEALEAVKSKRYDLVFMDIQMPVMDGYEATEAIRASSHPDAGTVPIIALTANAFREDVDKAHKHGMNGHMAKPLEYEKLIHTVSKYLK